MKDKAVFILTHNRANHVVTTKTLIDSGYTGEIFYVIDDEDPSEEVYRQFYGKNRSRLVRVRKRLIW